MAADECAGLEEGACSATSTCSWCFSEALPSSCYTVDQTEHLPEAVFQCQRPSAEE